ncbi:hypothetical protein [Planctomicrobium sp. SH664]|uniref:hypothetical protein n=1 Tax=Planctomicrobium sp. SH664 TaxID=3448125 RepID=UPI003F5C35A5
MSDFSITLPPDPEDARRVREAFAGGINITLPDGSPFSIEGGRLVSDPDNVLFLDPDNRDGEAQG